MLKKILLLVCILLFSNCDYSPIHLKNQNFNSNINIIHSTGDAEINNHITREINQKRNSYSEQIDLKIETNSSRRVLAKNSKGFATNYELKVISNFTLTFENQLHTFNIVEKLSYKNLSNSYEQSNYEKLIKRNFAKSIVSKLDLKISTIK